MSDSPVYDCFEKFAVDDTCSECEICGWQEREKELAEQERELEAWQARIQSEASRQIEEREGTLQAWQTRLERKQRELGTMQSNLEVSEVSSRRPLQLMQCACSKVKIASQHGQPL